MSRSDYHIRTTEVEGLKVHIYHDESPSHPDEGTDDLFIVSFSNYFHIVRKNTWDGVEDFRDFIHPRFREDIEDVEEGTDYSDPGQEPQDNQSDPVWRAKYLEACDDQIEALLHEAEEGTPFDNEAGIKAAGQSYRERHDLWYEWQRYKVSHAEWACFVLIVTNYGGGHIGLSLGDIYEGGEEDRWGNPKDPGGFVMVKKSAGWNDDFRKVAETLVKEWQSYCDGEVYGYVVEDEEGEEIDSCWGYVGDIDYCEENGLDMARAELTQRKARMTA